MKSKKVKLFALVSACMLAGCAAVVAACDFSFNSKELESVTIDTSEVQKVFTRGEEFTSDGLVVTAHYDDGSKAVLKSGYHVRGVEIDHVTTEETKAAGKDTVRVIYGEKEADYDVEIIQVDRLDLDLDRVTRTFVQHEAFTYEGLGVYAVFSNGERVDLAALGEDAYQVSYEEGDLQDVTATAGTHTVTVSTVAPAFTNEKGEPLPEDDCERTYTATYTVTVRPAAAATHRVTVECDPVEGGSYTLDAVDGVYTEGSTATLTVTPNATYAVESVKTGDDELHANEEGKYTFAVDGDVTVSVKFVKKSLSNFNNYMLENVGGKVRLQFYLAYEGYTEEEMYAAVLLIGEREVERVRLGAVTLFYFELPTDLDKGTHDLSVKMPDGQTFAVVFDPANFANTNPNSMELGDNIYTFGLSDENRMQLTVSAAERTVTIAEVDPAQGSITVKRGDAEIHSGDKVPVGTELTVEAKPAEGYAVDSVMAGSEKVELTGNKGSFTVNGDVTVTANFVREGSTSHTLTVNANEGGTYELAPQAGDEGYEKGAQVKLTVKPNPHYGYNIAVTGAEYTNEGDVYTITVGDSAVTVTIDFYERSFDRPHNAIVNSGEGLVFFAFTTGYTGSELKNITLLVGETEVANYEAGYAEDLSGDGGARVFRFHVQEVKTAGKFALRIKFSESDIYDLTLASDAGFELDNLSYLFSNEGGQCYLTVTDNSAPKEEGISVTPDTVKYTVGDTFKAEDFTVTYTSATGETSALSLGEDGYSVHLGAKDGAAVTEGYAFNEATELTLVFVYKDFEVSVNVTVSAKTEVREVTITNLEFYTDLFAYLYMGSEDLDAVKDAARMTTNGVQTVHNANKGFEYITTRLIVMVDAPNKNSYEFVWYNDADEIIARGTYVTGSGEEPAEKRVTGFHDHEIWMDEPANTMVTVNFWVDTEGYTKEELMAARLVVNGQEIAPRASSEYMIGGEGRSKLWFELVSLEEITQAPLQLKLGDELIDVVSTTGGLGSKTLNGREYVLESSGSNQLLLTVRKSEP